jgi:hypothetical protein
MNIDNKITALLVTHEIGMFVRSGQLDLSGSLP